MPAIATHYYFGQDVYKKLPDDVKAIINESKQAFDLGLQGPDIFFYYQPIKRHVVNIYGHVLHSKSAKEFYEKAVEYLRETNDLVAFSYLMGYTCHFALDSECHGLINELAPSVSEHIMLETELDRIILKTRLNMPPEEVKRSEFVYGNKVVAEAASKIYRERTTREVEDSISSMRFYTRCIHSPGGLKHSMLNKIERFVNKSGNFTCLSMTKKPYEGFEELAEKIYALWDNSVSVGLELSDNLYEAVVFEDRLSRGFDKNFE